MINTQPIEHKVSNAAGDLDIQEVFYTLQGEGPYGGHPAVFVRLAGCNLLCQGCDTDYTSKRKLQTVAEIIMAAAALFDAHLVPGPHVERLIVLTGGEPFRQNISPLAHAMVDLGWTVQVETNGTLHLPTFPYGSCYIVCSPKTPILCPALPIHYYKYVMQDGHVDSNDGLPTSVLGMPTAPARPPLHQKSVVYLQPMDEKDEVKNLINRQTCVESCLKFGYRLNLQLQKLVQLP